MNIIRKRKVEDCKEISHIVTVAWNETYKGIVPDWFLEELKSNEEERTKNSIEKFYENNNILISSERMWTKSTTCPQ